MTVHIPSALRSYTAQRGEIEVDASTVADALTQLDGRFPVSGFASSRSRIPSGRTFDCS